MEPYGGKRVREKKREGNDYVADLDEKNLNGEKALRRHPFSSFDDEF